MTGKKLFAMLVITVSVFIVAATGHAGSTASPGNFTDASAFGESGKLSEKGMLQPAYSSKIDRILTLVRTKSDDPRVLGQIRHKLLGISGERLLMISSLSDRIIAHDGETGTDVAYLLMTTLIILS